MKQTIIATLVIAISTAVWIGLLHASNNKLEQRCQDQGGSVISRLGQPSFCLTPPLAKSTDV
jgi:hypothetical protein